MSRLFVGNLPDDVREGEVRDLFDKFGRITEMRVKAPRAPGAPAFAFVEFDHPRDAEEAIRRRDGRRFGNDRLRVEVAKGGPREPRGPRGPPGRGPPPPRARGPPQRTPFRVCVEGLPVSASWQDLKDHMRRAGDVGFTDVSKDGSGVVEYMNESDMMYALEKLDNSEFSNRFDDRSVIRVFREGAAPPRGRSPSRSRSRSRGRRHSRRSRSRSRDRRSPTPDDKRSHSRSRSGSRRRSPTPDDKRSRSRSHSRSRSPTPDDKRSRSRSGSRRRSPTPEEKRSASAEKPASPAPAVEAEENGKEEAE